jgi:hypothetical protein
MTAASPAMRLRESRILVPGRCKIILQWFLVYIARLDDRFAGEAPNPFSGKNHHVAPVLEILSWTARAGEPLGHGADDAQSRHRQCAERAHGAVLRAAGFGRTHRHRRHVALAYIHLVDHAPMGAPPVPDSIKAMFRSVFKGALILSGGYDAARAESDLAAGKCDLIAVGRPFLANPDLLARWQAGAAVNAPDFGTFYTPGPKGYTDYPALG